MKRYIRASIAGDTTDLNKIGRYYTEKVNEYLSYGDNPGYDFVGVSRDEILDDNDTFPGNHLAGFEIQLSPEPRGYLNFYMLEEDGKYKLPGWLDKENLKRCGAFVYEYMKYVVRDPSLYIREYDIPMVEDY